MESNSEQASSTTELRPWGSFKTIGDIDNPNYKVKILTIKAGQKLNWRSHFHKDIIGVVITGIVKISKGQTVQMLSADENFKIHKFTQYELDNPGSIETLLATVELGEYLGEDDIARYE